MANKDLALVATLFNDKKVLLEPNYTTRKCAYRYLSGSEMLMNKLDIKNGKSHIWQEVPLYTTVENGETLVFATIEANPIVLNRF